jgi:hypothetical protein
MLYSDIDLISNLESCVMLAQLNGKDCIDTLLTKLNHVWEGFLYHN